MLKSIPKVLFEKNLLPSVNLSLDGREPLNLLHNFYLSKKGSMVVADILEGVISDKRKRIGTLTAPPGSGKSYLALFIGSLLTASPDWNSNLDQIIEKQNKTHSARISDMLKTFRFSKERFLPVYITGESFSLKKLIIENILISLESFVTGEYGEILYEHFKEDLQFNRRSSETKKLISRIIDQIQDKDSFFVIYKLTLKLLKKQNFIGFALFHDEFNRFLSSPSTLNSIDLDFLQDFAEYNLRLRDMKVVHYLLMHKGISQYLTGVSEEKRKDWLKIEGRFYPIYFQEELSDVYGLISNFLYDNDSFREGKKKEDIIFQEINKAYQINPVLKEEIGNELSEISFKAYPLHITTLISMPLLSSLLGQNERTIYTYLSSITGKKYSGFLRVDALYDYFDSSIDKLGLEDSLLSKWQFGRNALDEVSDKLERNVIKILTVLSVINKQTILPCKSEWIDFCIGNEAFNRRENGEIKKILKELVNKNQAIFRESTETYQIYYGSSIHLHSKVEEKAKYLTNSELQSALDKSFPLRPIYANAYNAEYYTSRFYTRKFIFESTIIDAVQFFIEENEKNKKNANLSKEEIRVGTLKFLLNLKEGEKKSGSAGIIIYYLGNQDSIYCKTISSIIREDDLGKSFVLISSKESFYHLDLFRRYEAVLLLKDDNELLSVDQRVSEDIKIYLSDLSEKIEQLLKSHFQFSSSTIVSHNSYKLTTFESLGGLISEIIKFRFPLCPKINCEFIVRESLSPVIRNTRKKLIRALLTGDHSHSTKDNGYGPDVAIFRSLFVAKNLFLEKEGSLSFNFSTHTDFKGNPDHQVRIP
jgi:hypothetical protein